MLISLLTAAIAPGLALLTYFYLKDKYEAEPVNMVIKLYILGLIIVIPTMILQHGFLLGFGESKALFSFVISGGIEECMKWLIIYFIIYKHAEFDEPYDGIVYAVAASIGFATLENVIFAVTQTSTFSDLLVRAFLPVSGHALFGVIMGFYLGKAKFSQGTLVTKYLLYSLMLPILWHGIFDYILLISKSFWVWFIVPFMILLWIKGIWRVNLANAGSPTKPRIMGNYTE